MTQVYLILAVVCLIVGVVGVIMALFTFFRYDIREAVDIVSGKASKRQISQIRQRTSTVRTMSGNPIANRQVWNGQVERVERVDSGTYDTPDTPLPRGGYPGRAVQAYPSQAAPKTMPEVMPQAVSRMQPYPGEHFTDVLDGATFDDGLTDEQRGFSVIYDQLVVHTTERIPW